MAIVVEVRGVGLKRFREAARKLGEKKARRAYARALNRTNQRAHTAVLRRSALPGQVGLSRGEVIAFGAIRKGRATAARLSADIRSRGPHLKLAIFGAQQFSFGVRASPWGETQRFASAFLHAGFPGSGIPVRDGNVYRRASSSSYPIKPMFGPAIPKEIVKDESGDAWENAAQTLDNRVAHEVRAITAGVVS